MVKIWIGNITPLLELNKLEVYYNQLPIQREEKADRQMVPLKKAQSVGAWILWNRMKEQYNLTDENVYNLSHSGELVMCVAATGEDGAMNHRIRLGCDIEKVREVNEKLPERFFAPSEIERIKQEPTKERQREVFFRLWVLKESYMKATRQGMGLDMKSFEIRLGDSSAIIEQPKEHFGQYHLHEFDWFGGHQEYKMAVCTTSKKVDKTLHEFEF